MRRSKALGAASAAALVAVPLALAAAPSFGSSHREAPNSLAGPDG